MIALLQSTVPTIINFIFFFYTCAFRTVTCCLFILFILYVLLNHIL